MTKEKQIEIVDEICGSIRVELTLRIKRGSIPEEWDGHELRCLVERKAQQMAASTVINRNKGRKRALDFRNHCICNNL